MKRILLTLAALGTALTMQAKVVLPGIFGDNMVLQQQSEAQFWGKAAPGKKVTIRPSWSTQGITANVGKDGRWHTNARLLQQMMSWWLNAPPQNNDITLPNTFSQSLYDVLMHQRNLAWRDKLRAMPPGRYVVAVGALHLYGEGNLPQMLR